MITITIHGNIVINLGGTDDGLLSQLTQLREIAMSLKTQAEIDAFVTQLNEGLAAVNSAAQAEGQQVAQVIEDLQSMIDNGVTDTSGLEAAISSLQGVRTNIEGIYVPPVDPENPEPPVVQPGPPAEPEPDPGTGTGTEVAEPITPDPVTEDTEPGTEE